MLVCDNNTENRRNKDRDGLSRSKSSRVMSLKECSQTNLMSGRNVKKKPTEERKKAGSETSIRRQSKLDMRPRPSISESSISTISSFRTARKDVDYKVSDTGVAMVCVTNSEEPPTGEVTANVTDSDMPLEVQKYAIAVSTDAVRGLRMFRDIARFIKRSMDCKFGQCWQCFVGKDFGVRLSYLPGSYMCVTVGEKAIIMYRSS